MDIAYLSQWYCLQHMIALLELPWHAINSPEKFASVLEKNQLLQLAKFVRDHQLTPSLYPDWNAMGLVKAYCVLMFYDLIQRIDISSKWGWLQSIQRNGKSWILLVYLPKSLVFEFKTRLQQLLQEKILVDYFFTEFKSESYQISLPSKDVFESELFLRSQKLLVTSPSAKPSIPFSFKFPKKTPDSTKILNPIRFIQYLSLENYPTLDSAQLWHDLQTFVSPIIFPELSPVIFPSMILYGQT